LSTSWGRLAEKTSPGGRCRANNCETAIRHRLDSRLTGAIILPMNQVLLLA
jgi:hypothetical protein